MFGALYKLIIIITIITLSYYNNNYYYSTDRHTVFLQDIPTALLPVIIDLSVWLFRSNLQERIPTPVLIYIYIYTYKYPPAKVVVCAEQHHRALTLRVMPDIYL